MRYTIIGFNQEMVISYERTTYENGKEKVIKLDVIDLLILQELADFMNRKSIIKHTIDDKIFFSIKYDAIIEDLPILGMKKQALRDRIDKLCFLGLVEKKVVKNESGSWAAFRVSENYECLLYSQEGGGVYQTTHPCVSNYTPNNYTTITNINKKEIDKSISQKTTQNDLFEQCWIAYKRKGSKKKALAQWEKMKDEDKELVLRHIQMYVGSRDLCYQKDFERYLRDNTFKEIIIKGNAVVFDPSKMEKDDEYKPEQSLLLAWDEKRKINIFIGFWDGAHIPDGYNDDNRPDGARVMLNNSRGIIEWSKAERKWITEKDKL